MKAKFLFQAMARIFLMIVLPGSFPAPQAQAALAKPLAGTFTTCAAQTQIPVAECGALVALYNSTNGAGWTDHTGWLQTVTPCSWAGVTCGGGTNVTALNLESNQLSGSIPAGLGNLTKLEVLFLYNNALSGSLPAGLGNLANLTDLWLGINHLSGSIPAELGNLTNIKFLDLSSNALSGSIPAQLGSLANLTLLNLSTNVLSGSIPAELGNLTNLTALGLANNQLTGEIPVSIVNLTNLVNLSLPVCGPTSSDPAVLSFIKARVPDWPNRPCLIASLTSSGAQDGWVLESSETSNVGGALNSATITFNLGDDKTKKQYRSILSFSTGASLPDNAVITKVTLKVQKSAIVGGGNPVTTFGGFMVDIKNGFFGAAAALQSADFQAAASKTYGPFKPAPVSNWYTLDLTAARAFVNKLATASGLTQIRLRFKLDDNNDGVANYLSLY
ncbi:MAG: hypothetical protein WA821_23880, partial [Anaerolineales bacterium]